MKKLTLNLLTLGAAAIILSSCGGVSKMVENSNTVKYEVTPSPLETQGGEVAVTIKTTFPEKYFNKKAVIEVTPVIKYDGGRTELEKTTLQGESVEENNKVIPYVGGDVTISGKVPYKPEMRNSDLMIEMSARIKNKDAVAIPAIKIADGVIATETLVKNDPQSIVMKDKFQRVTSDSYAADIHYVINQAEIRNSELKADDIKSLQNELSSAVKDPSYTIKGAQISSYASPDGPMDLNEKLSGNRGNAAEKYLTQQLKKMKVEGFDAEGFLKSIETAEDWDGFKKLMEASDVKDKELILRVLSMHSDPNVREQEIKNLSAAFEEIKTEILPKLRRSQMAVNVDVTGLSDEEIAALAKDNIDSLNLEETLYAATLTTDMNEKLRIYEAAAKNNPGDVRAINNVGYIQMMLGNTSDAKQAFEKAQQIEDNDVVKNNLGTVALADGDMATAEQLFTSAMGAGDAVNYNLGIIKIKQGDYDAAVNYFGNKPSFNAALAQLLNDETDKSISTLGELGETDDAMVYYLKAVAGARGNNIELAVNNLRRAFELDSSLKQFAKEDAEFLKVLTNEAVAALLD